MREGSAKLSQQIRDKENEIRSLKRKLEAQVEKSSNLEREIDQANAKLAKARGGGSRSRMSQPSSPPGREERQQWDEEKLELQVKRIVSYKSNFSTLNCLNYMRKNY